MVAGRRKRRGTFRNPVLASGTNAKFIYDLIKLNPDCTAEFIELKGFNNQSITILKEEGLIITTGKSRGFSTYRIAEGNETGLGRDPIIFDVAIFVNDLGEFSSAIKLIDESPTSTEHNPRLVFAKRVLMKVPRSDENMEGEYMGGVQIFAKEPKSTILTEVKEDKVISDIDFVTIHKD